MDIVDASKDIENVSMNIEGRWLLIFPLILIYSMNIPVSKNTGCVSVNTDNVLVQNWNKYRERFQWMLNVWWIQKC